jgi:hypothetical protein
MTPEQVEALDAARVALVAEQARQHEQAIRNEQIRQHEHLMQESLRQGPEPPQPDLGIGF